MGASPSTVDTLTSCKHSFSGSLGKLWFGKEIAIFGNYTISLPHNMSISITGNKHSVCITEHRTKVSAMMLTSLFYYTLGILSISRHKKISVIENGSLGDWISLQSLRWIVKHQTVSCLSSTTSSKKSYFFFSYWNPSAHWHHIGIKSVMVFPAWNPVRISATRQNSHTNMRAPAFFFLFL